MPGTVLWPGNQDTYSRQNFQIPKMTLWSKILIESSAIASTFQTEGKRKEKKKAWLFLLRSLFGICICHFCLHPPLASI